MLAATSAAWSVEVYMSDINGLYGTTGTNLGNCMVCHTPVSGGARNPYGADFTAAMTSNTPSGVVAALGHRRSGF